MKESYGEGLATHTGPESCVGAREGGGEALTGERAGRVLSREIHTPRKRYSGVPTPWKKAEGHTGGVDTARRARDPARSETPSMHGNTSRGNREIPWSPVAPWAAGRIGKSKDARR